MSEVKQYAERDAMTLDDAGGYYLRHVLAMTGEKLHSKGDIAAELGWRDMQIAKLKAERDALAAENAVLDSEIGAIADAYETGLKDLLAHEIDTAINTSTPATDAFINSVRAEGVEMFAVNQRKVADQHDADNRNVWADERRISADQAVSFANQLRAGKGGE